MTDEITPYEMLRMHIQNQDRMRRLEDCVSVTNNSLAELKEMVGRIDERTKQTEKEAEQVDDLNNALDTVKSDVNRAKGAIGFGMFVLAMIEAAQAVWTMVHAGPK